MFEKLKEWWNLFNFKRHFMSVVVSRSDSLTIKDNLKQLPVHVFCMGFAIGVPFTMEPVEASNKENDEIPYIVFYIMVDKEKWFPWFTKRKVVETLRKELKFRWSYGSDTQFD